MRKQYSWMSAESLRNHSPLPLASYAAHVEREPTSAAAVGLAPPGAADAISSPTTWLRRTRCGRRVCAPDVPARAATTDSLPPGRYRPSGPCTSASDASTIVSIGSHHSSGRSITAVAPSVATAACGSERVDGDTALVLHRQRHRQAVERSLAHRVGGREPLVRRGLRERRTRRQVDDARRDVQHVTTAALRHRSDHGLRELRTARARSPRRPRATAYRTPSRTGGSNRPRRCSRARRSARALARPRRSARRGAWWRRPDRRPTAPPRRRGLGSRRQAPPAIRAGGRRSRVRGSAPRSRPGPLQPRTAVRCPRRSLCSRR